VNGIWAVVPVKELAGAKQRLSSCLSREERRLLATTMFEDVLDAVSAVKELAGVLVVTVDPAAISLASRYGARIVTEGAREGHTGAVTAAARLLAAEGRDGMLTVPGDIPLVTASEVGRLVAAHRPAPSFTIVPSHDEGGSNAIVLSPPNAVPLRFGVDSFFPHLRAAEARGIRPTVLRLPGIALDIDNPEDLAAFALQPSPTRTRAFLAENAMLPPLSRARMQL